MSYPLRQVGLVVLVILIPGPALVAQSSPGTTAGSYWTDVALEPNQCDNVVVRPGLTEVKHTAGTDSVILSHAGQEYQGAVAKNGDFATAPRDLTFGTTGYRIAIAGRLTGDSLTAVVTVRTRDQTTGTQCEYRVRWSGVKGQQQRTQ
jgi:hypothetical protein